MKFLRLSTVLAISGAAAAGYLLFWTSQNVQQEEDRLARLQKGVHSEQQAIRVLDAEWDYLNRPDRLEDLATTYLGMTSAAAYNVSEDASALPDAFIPALPQEKPVFEAQPAVLRAAPAFSSAPAVPLPRLKPEKKAQSFQSLLDELNKQGGKP